MNEIERILEEYKKRERIEPLDTALNELYNKVKACVPDELTVNSPSYFADYRKDGGHVIGYNQCRQATLTNIDKLFGR